MKNLRSMLIIATLVAAAGIILALKQGKPAEASPTPPAALPRLVDLGADKCIPCKMMAPILADLRKTCAGKLDVVFIDVWKEPDAGNRYGINLIPTQIFFDRTGKELFRHEGFFAKEDILAKWREFGVELPAGGGNPAEPASGETGRQALR